MLQDKLVTIICLCYNHEKFVIESLQSVINQTYKNIEILIVDDFSTDNSVATIKNWLQDYPEIKLIINDKNIGNTKSFNKALLQVNGDYITDFATDDILLPNCIEKQIHCFENSSFKNLGAVYGNVELILENGTFYNYYFPVDKELKVIEKRKTGNIYIDVLSGGNSMCSVSAMYKKEVYEQLSGYDEDLKYEDLDFWIRASRNYEFDFIDSILVKKRIVPNSLGSGFAIRNDYNSRKINYSTFCSLKKALKLNKTKSEHKALLKRIHYEIFSNFHIKDHNLMFLCLSLALKTRMKILLTRKS